MYACRFVLPSVLYAVNNNIYYAGLMLVPPPIWIILTSFRTVVTASLYKVRERSYYARPSTYMDHPHIIPHCCHRIAIQGEREGFMLVPPPIWIILTSYCTVITASLYKVRERSFYARPSSYMIILTSFRTVVTASLYKVRERILCSSLLLYGSSSPHSVLLSPHHYTR